MRVSLDQLEALEAIVRTGSFAGAAASLHKAQSAVSYAIRQLEESLGVTVFDRSGHRAVLTSAGVAILDEGRIVLARARRISWLADQFAGGWEPRLHVVVDGALPMGPLLSALKQMSDEGVPTHIQLRTEYLGGVQRRFEADGSDLMIAKEIRREPWMEVRALTEVTMVLVAAADHPVHQTDQPHDTTSLQRFLELAVHDSAEETSAVDTNDIEGARVFYLGDFNAKRDGLRIGLGFGWMPEPLVAEDLTRGALRLVRYTPGATRRFTPWLVTRTDRPVGRAAQRLTDLLTA
jgi:DNA-binding transcriptional LysR family regulator